METILNHTLEALREGRDVGEAMTTLVAGLDQTRAALPPEEWRQWIESTARRHPVAPKVWEDPFVGHSAARPRGYPGDAELLDFIYGCENVRPRIEAATPLGKKLYRFSSATPAPEAVRLRSALTATEIDRLAAGGRSPYILSVACGHLREARLAQSVAAGALGRFVGVDQDPQSLDLVRREYGRFGVEALEYSVKEVIRRGDVLGAFDFIYVLGLYDYLSDDTGSRLLSRLFGMLKPGGKIWVANFTGSIWAAGFMEAMMDWWLIYRSPEEMLKLGETVPRSAAARREVFLDPTGSVAFLELVRGR
jgi:extracellular factor (EF) 3-hydroxypalmitic acid methyl ester biosynthesis protein